MNWRLMAFAGILPASIFSLLALTPLGVEIEQRFGLDSLFKLRGAEVPPQEVVVVAINLATSRQLGAPSKLYQWSRFHHGALVDVLKHRGASVVVFDMLFQEARDAAGDQAFAQAIARSGNVVLATELWVDGQQVVETDAGAVVIKPVFEDPPLPMLGNVALTTAPFVLPKVPEQVRQYWTFRDDVGGLPSLPVAALHAYVLPQVREVLSTNGGIVDDAQMMAKLVRLRQSINRDGALGARQLSGDVRLLAGDATHRDITSVLLDAWREPNSRFINFYGGPGTIPTLSYEQVVQTPLTQSLPVDLEAKVVFVGFAEQIVQKQQDNFFTVFSTPDGRDLAGVEVAATAFGNLLDGSAIRPLTFGGHMLSIVLWGIVLGAVAVLIPWPFTPWALMAVSGVYAITVYGVFVSMHMWIPVVIPFVFQPLATLLAVIYWHYRVYRTQRERARRALACYLPDEVVKNVVNAHDVMRPGGERVFGVCLYTDAQRYTALAEKIDSDDLNRILNRYLEIIFKPVRQHNGWVSDVTGDATMALWTAPGLTPQLAQDACKTALQIADAVAAFNRNSIEARLPTRISLHCGEFTLGNVGTDSRLEYRGVGDVVNTVTRVDGVNKLLNTTILASEEVVRLVNGIVTRDVGSFRVVGKQNVIKLHEIVGAEGEVGGQTFDEIMLFSQALHQLQLNDWQGAEERLSLLRAANPDDGPTAFYWRLSREFQQKPPPKPWVGVIDVPEK